MANAYESLRDKVAVVTGGASGIGWSTAELLASYGAKVVLADVNGEVVQEKAAQITTKGGQALSFALDITRLEQVQELFKYTREQFGSVQILVNSAGIVGPNQPAVKVNLADWQKTLDINLTGTFLCCQAALQDMQPAGYGRIVNLASIAGKEGNPNLTAYSASKAGVIGLTKALAKEVAQSGIIINALAPAVIATPINKNTSPETVQYMVSKIPLGRVGEPEEVAELICWMASESCSFTTGFCFDASGGRATY